MTHGITRTAHVCDGEPAIAGKHVRTRDVLDRFLAGRSLESIASELKLDRWEAEQALRFECCRACPCESCSWAMKIGMSTPKPPPKPPVRVPKPKPTQGG